MYLRPPFLAHSHLQAASASLKKLKVFREGQGAINQSWTCNNPRTYRATMTEESSDVPRELIGKIRAVVGFPSSSAYSSPPPPFPPLPSRRSLEVSAPLRGRVVLGRVTGGRWEVCSHSTAFRAKCGEGRRRGGIGSPQEVGGRGVSTVSPGNLLLPRRGGPGWWKKGAGHLRLGSSASEGSPLRRPAHCPKLEKVRESLSEGQVESAQ